MKEKGKGDPANPHASYSWVQMFSLNRTSLTKIACLLVCSPSDVTAKPRPFEPRRTLLLFTKWKQAKMSSFHVFHSRVCILLKNFPMSFLLTNKQTATRKQTLSTHAHNTCTFNITCPKLAFIVSTCTDFITVTLPILEIKVLMMDLLNISSVGSRHTRRYKTRN